MIENELVPMYETSTGERVVNGRELWNTLKSKRQFADWVKNRFNDCDDQENIDYESFSQKNENGGRSIEYIYVDTFQELYDLVTEKVGALA